MIENNVPVCINIDVFSSWYLRHNLNTRLISVIYKLNNFSLSRFYYFYDTKVRHCFSVSLVHLSLISLYRDKLEESNSLCSLSPSPSLPLVYSIATFTHFLFSLLSLTFSRLSHTHACTYTHITFLFNILSL